MTGRERQVYFLQKIKIKLCAYSVCVLLGLCVSVLRGVGAGHTGDLPAVGHNEVEGHRHFVLWRWMGRTLHVKLLRVRTHTHYMSQDATG